MDEKVLENWIAEGNVSFPQVLLKNYTKLGLNEQEMMCILQIQSFATDKESFPSMEDIAARMSLSAAQVMAIVDGLMKKGILTIEQNASQAVISEAFSLQPLWKKLSLLYWNKEEEAKVASQQQTEVNLYTIFEAEFGRPLSPMEAEMISSWLDQDGMSNEVIQEALKEAVISQKLNFRYIDRILLNWTKQGVKTSQDAKKVSENFHKSNGQEENTEVKKSDGSIPLYDWLEKRKG